MTLVIASDPVLLLIAALRSNNYGPEFALFPPYEYN